MDKRILNYRLQRQMYKEINDMCARKDSESVELGSHYETAEEKEQRLKRQRCEELRRQRWTLHSAKGSE